MYPLQKFYLQNTTNIRIYQKSMDLTFFADLNSCTYIATETFPSCDSQNYYFTSENNCFQWHIIFIYFALAGFFFFLGILKISLYFIRSQSNRWTKTNQYFFHGELQNHFCSSEAWVALIWHTLFPLNIYGGSIQICNLTVNCLYLCYCIFTCV